MKRTREEAHTGGEGDMGDEYDEGDYDYDYDFVDESNIDYSDLGVSLTDGGMPTDVEETQTTTKLKEFVAHPQDDIQRTLSSYIEEVKNVMEITPGDARVLLRHYRWDKDKLMEDFFADSDRTANLAGIKLNKPKQQARAGVIECPICMDDIEPKDQYALACGHTYCKNCWNSYLNEKLENGKESLTATCPFPKCTIACTAETFGLFLSPANFNRYLRFDSESYIDLSSNRKWCPSPECNCYIETGSSEFEAPVQCKCGFRFCFKCNDFEIGDHAPAACSEVELWMKKAADESENVKWMQANTKKCPKCNSHIEKNGGCMHMTCRKCSHEFCWLCRDNWRGHKACNKSQQVQQEEQQAKTAKSELEKYMFYFHRYEAHRDAMKIADKQRKQAKAKSITLMESLGVRSQDVKFILEAAEQLIRNRNMLQYSYVYGYYLTSRRIRSEEKQLFEYLQQDLEHHTDKLSELYEKSLETMQALQEFSKWREDVTNYTRVSKKFLDNFVEGVILKTLTTPEGDHLTEDERFYHTQLEQLESMGLPRDLTLPLLIKFDGNVNSVVSEVFK